MQIRDGEKYELFFVKCTVKYKPRPVIFHIIDQLSRNFFEFLGLKACSVFRKLEKTKRGFTVF